MEPDRTVAAIPVGKPASQVAQIASALEPAREAVPGMLEEEGSRARKAEPVAAASMAELLAAVFPEEAESVDEVVMAEQVREAEDPASALALELAAVSPAEPAVRVAQSQTPTPSRCLL